MPAISIKSLTKTYPPNVQAVKDISLSIQKGEFFALLGPNGAGKSTTINIMTGLTNKTSGSIKLYGKDTVNEYQEARALIGLVPQEFNFDQFEKVYNIMWFNAGYFGIPKKEREPRIKELLTDLGLWEKRKMKAMTLSGGMKRKLMIARALLHKPKIIILDEPTAGVDVETRKSIWKFMQKINKEGVTILLTTHYIEEAEQLCDRIAIINKGEIIALEKKEKLMELFGTETLHVTFDNLKEIPKQLEKYNPEKEKDKLSMAIPKGTPITTILKDIQATKLHITKIETIKNKLEDIFIQLTHEK